MAETQQSENQGGKEVEIAEVTKFLQSLNALLTENQDTLTILPESIRKLVHELEAHSTQNTRTVSADNTRNQDDANYYKSKYKDLKAKSRTTDKELMARQERIAELERKLDSKQEEYDKEREQNRQKFAEKEKTAAELDKELASQEDFFKERKQRLEKELAESEKTIAELERKLDSKQEEYDKEREQNRQKFAEKENIIAELQRKLDSKQEEYDKEREQNRQKFAEKEKIVAELDKELASQEDFFKEQKQRREKELAESKKTIAALERKLVSKQEKYDKEREQNRQKFAEKERVLHLEKLERERARQHHVDELRDKGTKMRTLEARNEELTRQLEEHRIRNENLSADAEKTNLELRHYIERFQRQEETYKSDLSLKETELRETKERLSYREKEVKSLIHDVQRYKSRLASLCEKRVNQDQRSVENVLASNRPSDVERDFKEFFDSNREDARDVIQSVYGSEKKEDVQIYYPRIVCTILVAAYEVTKNVKEAVLDLFKESTKKLVQQAPEVGRNFHLSRMDNNFVFYPISIDVCETSEKSTDVIDALLNSLKESAHICDLECLEKDVCEYAWKIWNEWYEETSSFTLAPSQKVLTELIRSGYIEACLRLAWRMVTQRPPLRLEYNSSIFDHHIHKKANGDTSLEEITCYLWPCLFDGGAKLICPGLVLCKM